MSKFSDRAEKFYMDQFNTMFAEDEKMQKIHKNIVEKFSKSNDKELFEEVLKPITNATIKGKKRIINEEEGEDDESLGFEFSNDEENVDPEDEPIDDEEEMSDDEMDPMDEADEALEEVDLEDLSNAAKIEIIRSVIDSAQNMADEEDEISFDDFVQEVSAVIDEFQYEDEGEEGEEMPEDEYEGEEEPEYEDEGEGEEGMEEEPEDEEAGMVEESVKPKKTSKSKKVFTESSKKKIKLKNGKRLVI